MKTAIGKTKQRSEKNVRKEWFFKEQDEKDGANGGAQKGKDDYKERCTEQQDSRAGVGN